MNVKWLFSVKSCRNVTGLRFVLLNPYFAIRASQNTIHVVPLSMEHTSVYRYSTVTEARCNSGATYRPELETEAWRTNSETGNRSWQSETTVGSRWPLWLQLCVVECDNMTAVRFITVIGMHWYISFLWSLEWDDLAEDLDQDLLCRVHRSYM